MLIKPK